MDKNRKILIIVGVVVIAALCVTAGVLGANNSKKSIQATVSNDPTITNLPTETTVNNTTDTVKEEVAVMTPDEAMEIVDKELSPYYKATSAHLTNGSPNPVYVVHIIHNDPNHSDYGEDGGNVTVDTVTGFVYHKGI